MTVIQLRTLLQHFPSDAEVRMIWDSEPRSAVVHVYLARNGQVMLADADESVYSVDARPMDAPGVEVRHWSLP